MTTNNQKLNIGVVGLGRMGQRHALNVLHRISKACLYSVCSPTPHELEWARNKLEPEGVKIFSDFYEMIDAPGLAAVIVASSTELHIEHTLAAVKRGICVLCEKPLTKDLAELSQLLHDLGEDGRSKVMVGFVRRFDEQYLTALRSIQNGSIGTPLIIRSQGAERLDKTGFFIEYARHSGGIFIDTVVHDIDLTLSFLGEENCKPKALWATGLIAYHQELKEFNDVDNAVGVVEFWGGRIAYYYHSRTTFHGYDNCTEIIGSEGKISINLVPNANRVQVSNIAGIQQDATPGWIERYQDAFVTELEVFVDAILMGRELPLKLSSALQGMKLAIALQESLVTGEKIEFDENGERKGLGLKALL